MVTFCPSTGSRDRRTACKWQVTLARRRASPRHVQLRPGSANAHCRDSKRTAIPNCCHRGIVVVIVVPVVHREQMQIRTGEFACAPPTDPGVDLERLLAISFFPDLPVAPGLGNDP